MFHTYVLYNRERNKIYIGQTSNIEMRLKRHNNELPTKRKSFAHVNNGRWDVIYQENFETREEALKREKQLKSQKGRGFIWNLMTNGGCSSAG